MDSGEIHAGGHTYDVKGGVQKVGSVEEGTVCALRGDRSVSCHIVNIYCEQASTKARGYE